MKNKYYLYYHFLFGNGIIEPNSSYISSQNQWFIKSEFVKELLTRLKQKYCIEFEAIFCD